MTDGNIAYLIMVVAVSLVFVAILAWAERRTRD